MTGRQRITNISEGKPVDRCGFWLGNPHWETWPILHEYFGTTDDEAVRVLLKDDFRWIQAGNYQHPKGKPMFDMQRKGKELSAAGYFADCESVTEVEDYDWPDPDYLDFTEVMNLLKNSLEVYRASGFWSPFFHEVCDFFGMENYFMKMYTHPEVVHAVTKQIVDFYLEANRRFFRAAGNMVDGFFFGNDFGTQSGLMISPELFGEFVSPYLKQLTEIGHEFDRQVILHSCGSIYRVIPDLIGFGVDALHPIQAKAANMDAESLAKDFRGKVAFIGGIDTQDILVNATPEQVKEDVRRVKDLLGPSVVISPSHEALLPNIPPQNIVAMAEAAME